MSGRLALGAIVGLTFLVSAGLLWLACRLFRVSWKGKPEPFRRSLLLTLVIFVLGWSLLALVVVAASGLTEWSPPTVARVALPPLGVIVPLAVLRLGLRVGWWRTLGVWLLWRVTNLLLVGLVVLAVRAWFAETLADVVPAEWLALLP